MATLLNTTINDTGYVQLPIGTTVQRPSTPTAGQTRYNSTIKTVEWYTGSNNLWYYLPNIYISNMVARYDAAEPASYSGSGTSWNDISGNGNNGTLVNSPTYSSTYGGGFSFNKSNNYVSLPTGLITSNDFTVIMWVKGDGTSGAQTLMANYPAGNFQLFYGTAYVGMYLGNSSAYADASLWYSSSIVQFAATRSGTVTQIYINGSLAIAGSSSSSVGGSVAFRMGTNISGGEQYGGTIYNCQVYNSATNGSNIYQNYLAMKSRFGV
jgi:hypothetical protein